MDKYQRHRLIWRLLYPAVHALLRRKFNLSHGNLETEGPVLVISNHVSAWDPLLVAMALRDRQLYYVASEHLFRLGLISRFLEWAVEPIPRRKATTGSDTAKACLRHLKAGRSVCIFAEGEQCWDGLSQAVFPATGKLVKLSGASLVTFRIEGGYLSCPRWGKSVRRGMVRCFPVRVYTPDELRKMTPQQINDTINRDIAEDAWQRQAAEQVSFRGKNPAEGLERMLYLCPACGRIGGLRTKGDEISCACGFSRRYTDTGFFSPTEPFPNLLEWDSWEKEKLRGRSFTHQDVLFSDSGLSLSRVSQDHGEQVLETGELRQYEDRLECGSRVFPVEGISDMAAVLTKLLLFSFEGEYYQLRGEKGSNIRKYYEFWKIKQGD